MFRVLLLCPVVVGALVLAGMGVVAEDEARREQPFGIEQRVPWTSSRVVGSPEPPPPFRLERAFPHLTFQEPVCIVQEPNSNRLFVAEFGGKIHSFPMDDATAQPELVLDIDRQLYSFSFHPRYEENGYLFVFSPLDPKDDSEEPQSRVSRFQVELGHVPPRCRPESETIIIEWPAGGHNGGEAIIGPDGYLYIATGDGSGGSDTKNTGQGVDDLLSVMMRLDVDHPDPGRAYAIPEDNPFVDYPGARPEIWAYGFRNPWRFSFDPQTGQPWVGDVGQDLWEMIYLVERGGNYGWSINEGSHPFHPNRERGPTPILPPVVEHHHSECRSITGGHVYQGEKFPELRGVYFYGDYQYGKIWGLRYDHDARKVTWQGELADTLVKMSSFGVARDGSIYALDYHSGEIYGLERGPTDATTTGTFPRTLSETGLFASVKDHQMAPGVIPYSVNAPFWSDGTLKHRYIALPGLSHIDFGDGPWGFPDGAVLVKSFSHETEVGNPASRRWIETRLLVHQDDRWVGYSYLWNDEQTDASLVAPEGRDILLTFTHPDDQEAVRHQPYRLPSRNECMFCHSRAAGFVLGLNTLQMNTVHDYGAVADNQLRTLNHLGIFREPLTMSPEEYPALPDPHDATADLDARARAYLHVNCAICHVADGGGNSLMQLSYDMTPEQMAIFDVPPIHDTFGIADARLIAPGDPERSVILHRLAKRGTGQMPPLSTHVIDDEAVTLLRDWIAQMTPPPNTPK